MTSQLSETGVYESGPGPWCVAVEKPLVRALCLIGVYCQSAPQTLRRAHEAPLGKIRIPRNTGNTPSTTRDSPPTIGAGHGKLPTRSPTTAARPAVDSTDILVGLRRYSLQGAYYRLGLTGGEDQHRHPGANPVRRAHRNPRRRHDSGRADSGAVLRHAS